MLFSYTVGRGRAQHAGNLLPDKAPSAPLLRSWYSLDSSRLFHKGTIQPRRHARNDSSIVAGKFGVRNRDRCSPPDVVRVVGQITGNLGLLHRRRISRHVGRGAVRGPDSGQTRQPRRESWTSTSLLGENNLVEESDGRVRSREYFSLVDEFVKS
jgi:hypothetical protein